MEDKSLLTLVSQRISAARRRTISLRMAPMIDMIFLLLLFFLVATKWRPAEDSLPFKLPAASAQQTRIGAPQPLVIYISAIQNGCTVQIGNLYSVRLEDKTIESDLTALMQKMADCMNTQKRFAADPIEIACQPDVKWEYVAKIYNMFFGAGLTDITFMMTERPNNDNANQLHQDKLVIFLCLLVSLLLLPKTLTPLPSPNDINNLTETAKFTADSFLQESFDLRLKYQYNGCSLNEH